MAIAPITGRFRKRVIFDVVGSLTLGTVGAYWFWYGFHLPFMKKRLDYDAKVKQEMALENKPYYDSVSALKE
ncbi:hypothetical protein HDU92_004914 [Lobulomyces angularis]|nr:hypothetical protein HDU92_004914 [Lobulomyces angularis]